MRSDSRFLFLAGIWCVQLTSIGKLIVLQGNYLTTISIRERCKGRRWNVAWIVARKRTRFHRLHISVPWKLSRDEQVKASPTMITPFLVLFS